MTQKTSTFTEVKYGWSYGESGWNTGMDENLLKFSYLFDANIDGIVSTLPSAVNGTAYFNTTDNRVYFVVENTYYSTVIPKWFSLKLKTSGSNYIFDGSSINQYTLSKADIGLGNVDNTSDANKPISSATQAAINSKANKGANSDITSLSGLTSPLSISQGGTGAVDGSGILYNLGLSSKSNSGGSALIGYKGRTLAERLSDIASVKDFNVKGDGSTDDTAAIQSAINSVSAVGGILYFPPGTYKISSQLTIPNTNNFVSQLTIIGSGPFSTFISATSNFSGTNMIQVLGTSQIRDLTISGSDKSVWGIRNSVGGGGLQTHIERIQFLSCKGTGGALINDSMGTLIFCKNIVNSCSIGINIVNWATQSVFTDNTILADSHGVILNNTGNSNEGLLFSRNFIGSVSGDGIQIVKGLDIVLTDNEFTPIQAAASGKVGIRFLGSCGPVRIRGNWIEGLVADNNSMSQISIEGNHFPNGTTCKLMGQTAGAIYNVTIKNNHFEGTSTAALINLQNCTNVDVAYNQADRGGASAGCYESGGSSIKWTFNRFSTGTGSFTSGSAFAFNIGGSGYTNAYSI